MYQIIQAPSEILRMKAGPVDLPVAKLQKIIAEMKATLLSQKNPEGVGLAANQVGLPYRLFVARFSTKREEPIRAFINPEIIKHGEELQPDPNEKAPLEGCLSLPKYYGVVKRWREIRIKYYVLSIKGALEQKEEDFSGFPAVVIQHEMDHLEGKIFVERILEQKGKLYKETGKDRKGKETWEEVKL